jgi:fatty-acyl-CoA synthase
MSLIESIKREWTYISGLAKLLRKVGEFPDGSTRTLASELEAACDRWPNNIAFVFEGRSGTYRELDQLANRVAHWALGQGLKRGDCVALFMENRPEYVAIWYGLAKVGVLTALINTNLQGQALAHCIRIANARTVILNAALIEPWSTTADLFEPKLSAFCLDGQADGVSNLGESLAQQPQTRPEASHGEGVTARDVALFIYTSGTTGLPKAARMTHARCLGIMLSFIEPCKVTERDRLYVTLPLYHSTGGMCGVGAALLSGAAIILRRRFSASHFWSEAISEKATVFVYIGELCRYLVNLPPSLEEKQHRIRTGFGNGLRPEVWTPFVARTGISRLVEFYGSTEGNFSMANLDGKPGAVGRIPPLLKARFPYTIVRFDVEKEAAVRGPDGLCLEAGVDEVGEAMGKIINDVARSRFEGYSDPSQTEKKIVRDVFEKGDAWFRTGDLMKRDALGYFYFVDRIGDTFRWKGENVSTNEVTETLSGFPGIAFANVYGVSVPATDGRAGMAAIVPCESINMSELYAFVAKSLPIYARPLFIRIQNEVDTTGTFKLKKTDLVEQGFNPAKTDDQILISDPASGSYVTVNQHIYDNILSGTMKF